MGKKQKKTKEKRAKKGSGFDSLIRDLAKSSRDSAADEIEYNGQKYGRDELEKLRNVNAAIDARSNRKSKTARKELKVLNKEREKLLLGFGADTDLRDASLDDLNKALATPAEPIVTSVVAIAPVKDEPAPPAPVQSDRPLVQMGAKQNKTSITAVRTKNSLTMTESYNNKYLVAATGKYMPEFKKPKIGKDSVKLTFPTSEEANTFYQEQAKQRLGEGFVVCDKNKKVMAYSNGDGTLYKADGQPYAAGEKLVSSNMSLEELKQKAANDTILAAKAEQEKYQLLSLARENAEKAAAKEAHAAEQAEETQEKRAERVVLAEQQLREKAAEEAKAAESSSQVKPPTTEPAGFNSVTGAQDRAEATAEEKQLNLAKMLEQTRTELKNNNGVTDVEINQKAKTLNELNSFKRSSLKPINTDTSQNNEAVVKKSSETTRPGNEHAAAQPKPQWMSDLSERNKMRTRDSSTNSSAASEKEYQKRSQQQTETRSGNAQVQTEFKSIVDKNKGEPLTPSQVKAEQVPGPKPAWMSKLRETNNQRRLTSAATSSLPGAPAPANGAATSFKPMDPNSDPNKKGMGTN